MTSISIAVIAAGILAVILLVVQLVGVNHRMQETPPPAVKLLGKRWTKKAIREAYDTCTLKTSKVDKYLPPKQGRRYIVVGGSGLVGGWIVEHLLQRGEQASSIRIVDLNQPRRPSIIESKVTYIKADVTDGKSVSNAFNAPWPPEVAKLPLTVFHTAAYINPYERKADYLTRYLQINVEGTRHVLASAKSAGCTAFIATSSSAICVKRPFYLSSPFWRSPKNWLQVSDNAEPPNLGTPLEKFTGCYAYSKAEAENLVRRADNKQQGFRTGAIRPGHAIYGHGDENPMSVTYDYLRRGGGPSWLSNMVANFVSAENVSLAHLLFEARLISPSKNLDVGGNAYAISDLCPPITYGDLYMLLTILAHPAYPCSFSEVPPLPLLLLSHLIEIFALLRHRYLPFLPEIKGDLGNLQPALFNVCTLHIIYDTTRARRELGYDSALETLDGFCKQVKEWNEKIDVALSGGKLPTGIMKPIKGLS